MPEDETPGQKFARLTKVMRECDKQIARERTYTQHIMTEEHQKAIRAGRIKA